MASRVLRVAVWAVWVALAGCGGHPLSPGHPADAGPSSDERSAPAPDALDAASPEPAAEPAPESCPGSLRRCGALCVDDTTDPQNCGGCGLPCDQCTNGRCIRILATGQPNPEPIAVTSTHVVWANQGLSQPDGTTRGAAILKVPIGGGPVETLVTSERRPNWLAIDSDYVYWTTPSTSTNPRPTYLPDGAVLKMPVAGGAATRLTSDQLDPYQIAVSANTVYWTTHTAVMSVATIGGTPTVFATGSQILALAVRSGKAYWADYLGMGGDTEALRSRALTPGAPTLTLSEGLRPGITLNLVASSRDVFWTAEGERGSVQRIAIGGGTPSTFFTADDDTLDVAIAADSDSLYWTNTQFSSAGKTGRILKAPLAGGAPITVSEAEAETHFIAIDARSLYFTNRARGTVVQVTPK
jgi:hypothetical protein